MVRCLSFGLDFSHCLSDTVLQVVVYFQYSPVSIVQFGSASSTKVNRNVCFELKAKELSSGQGSTQRRPCPELTFKNEPFRPSPKSCQKCDFSVFFALALMLNTGAWP